MAISVKLNKEITPMSWAGRQFRKVFTGRTGTISAQIAELAKSGDVNIHVSDNGLTTEAGILRKSLRLSTVLGYTASEITFEKGSTSEDVFNTIQVLRTVKPDLLPLNSHLWDLTTKEFDPCYYFSDEEINAKLAFDKYDPDGLIFNEKHFHSFAFVFTTLGTLSTTAILSYHNYTYGQEIDLGKLCFWGITSGALSYISSVLLYTIGLFINHTIASMHSHFFCHYIRDSRFIFSLIKENLTPENLSSLYKSPIGHYFIEEIINHPKTPRSILLLRAIQGYPSAFIRIYDSLTEAELNSNPHTLKVKHPKTPAVIVAQLLNNMFYPHLETPYQPGNEAGYFEEDVDEVVWNDETSKYVEKVRQKVWKDASPEIPYQPAGYSDYDLKAAANIINSHPAEKRLLILQELDKLNQELSVGIRPFIIIE